MSRAGRPRCVRRGTGPLRLASIACLVMLGLTSASGYAAERTYALVAAFPDRFLVGYGLDYRGRYRNLPYVAALDEAVFQ